MSLCYKKTLSQLNRDSLFVFFFLNLIYCGQRHVFSNIYLGGVIGL